MRKFVFPLERVMGWRRTQVRLEELKLERLHAERRKLEARRKFLAEESGRTLAGLVRAGPVHGGDLQALDRFRKSAAQQTVRLDASLKEQDRQIATQTDAVVGRRRDVRLIEQFRDEKFKKWQREFLKEIDQQAEESYLARFGADEFSEFTVG